MVTYRNDLSITPNGRLLRIRLSQNDRDFQMMFNLYTMTGRFVLESNSTVKLVGHHSDGTTFSVNGGIYETTAVVSGDPVLTRVPGESIAELRIAHGDKLLSTANFILEIEPKP